MKLSILNMSDTIFDNSITSFKISSAIIIAFNLVYGLIVNFYWYFIREPILKYYEAWWNSPHEKKNERFEEFRQKEIRDIILSTVIGISFVIFNLFLIYFLVYVRKPNLRLLWLLITKSENSIFLQRKWQRLQRFESTTSPNNSRRTKHRHTIDMHPYPVGTSSSIMH